MLQLDETFLNDFDMEALAIGELALRTHRFQQASSEDLKELERHVAKARALIAAKLPVRAVA